MNIKQKAEEFNRIKLEWHKMSMTAKYLSQIKSIEKNIEELESLDAVPEYCGETFMLSNDQINRLMEEVVNTNI
jgi:hypothetical protein